MASSTRAIVCALGAFTVACTALTGADDLSIEEQNQAVGQAEPEQRSGGSGARVGGKDAGSKTAPTTPTNTAPPSSSAPPAPPDAGTTTKTVTSIGCGQKTCTGATPHCCAAVGAYTCVADGTPCVGNRYRLTCDSPEDCATGEVCCALFGGANEGSRCMAAASCKNPEADRARMCTNGSHCSAGLACNGYIVDVGDVRLDLPGGLCIPQ